MQLIQQMHAALFFQRKTLMFSCYIDEADLAIVRRSLGSLDVAAAKLLQQMFAGTQSEGHDADRGGFIGAIEKNAGVTGVQVRHVVSLPESVGDEFLRIM